MKRQRHEANWTFLRWRVGLPQLRVLILWFVRILGIECTFFWWCVVGFGKIDCREPMGRRSIRGGGKLRWRRLAVGRHRRFLFVFGHHVVVSRIE